MAADRQHSRARASHGTLPHFTVGDYVFVARVRKQGKHKKLVSTWTGPWRVVNDDREHVYIVENIVTGETRDVHVARMRFYSDRHLQVTKRLQDVFQHREYQGEYHIRGITDVKKAKRSDEYVVRVLWEGMDDEECTWEPVSRVFADAPAVLRKELRRIRSEAGLKRAIQGRYSG